MTWYKRQQNLLAIMAYFAFQYGGWIITAHENSCFSSGRVDTLYHLNTIPSFPLFNATLREVKFQWEDEYKNIHRGHDNSQTSDIFPIFTLIFQPVAHMTRKHVNLYQISYHYTRCFVNYISVAQRAIPYVTGPTKINHVSSNYTELYFH